MPDWQQIVAQHGEIVWKAVSRLLGNEADAVDCYQDVFLAALEFSRKHEVQTWPGLLRRLATTKALMHLRRKYTSAGCAVSLPMDATMDPHARDSVQTAQERELAEHLCFALGRLNPQQAAVFCLVCLEDMSYREVGEQLELSANHVGVLLTRARSQLRMSLSAHRPGSAGPNSEFRP